MPWLGKDCAMRGFSCFVWLSFNSLIGRQKKKHYPLVQLYFTAFSPILTWRVFWQPERGEKKGDSPDICLKLMGKDSSDRDSIGALSVFDARSAKFLKKMPASCFITTIRQILLHRPRDAACNCENVSRELKAGRHSWAQRFALETANYPCLKLNWSRFNPDCDNCPN